MKKLIATIFIISFLFIGLNNNSKACTDFRLNNAGELNITARTMDFALNLESEVLVSPRNIEMESSAPDGKKAIKWKSKYGFVGMNVLHTDQIADGLNEVGLSGAGLWFTDGQYPDPKLQPKNEAFLAQIDLLKWTLSNFSSVEEVKVNIKKVNVYGRVFKELGETITPIHFVFHDAHGKNLLIEFINGEMHLYDNPIGVVTNNPKLEWHLTHLRQYLNISADEPQPKDFSGIEIKKLGLGSGMLGLPGDMSPPSRFVRTVLLNQNSEMVKTAKKAVNQAFNIINNIFVVPGASSSGDITEWNLVRDHDNLKYYIKTIKSWTVQEVNIKEINFDKLKEVKRLPIPKGFDSNPLKVSF